MGLIVEYIQKPTDRFFISVFTSIFGINTTLSYVTHEWWEQGVDSRTKDYFLVDISGYTITVILFLYVFIMVYVIPKSMEKKKPFDLKNIMIFYNFVVVLMNGYFFFYAVYHIRDMYEFSNPKYDTSEKAMNFIKTAHLYYLSKYVDFLDTVFMGLKKKGSQITFLHIWHHMSMPLGGWLMLRYVPYMPTELIVPLLNGFIHVVMYSYYGLAALGPHMQKYLWWKKYITQMQLIQFTIGLTWYTFVLFKSIDLPFLYLGINFFQGALLFVLFANFYIKAYKSKGKQNLKSN